MSSVSEQGWFERTGIFQEVNLPSRLNLILGGSNIYLLSFIGGFKGLQLSLDDEQETTF